MKRIGILGEIGSGKSFVAKKFQFPVFDADDVVGKLYREDKKIFYKLKKILPNYFIKFPIEKSVVTNAQYFEVILETFEVINGFF